LHRDAKFRFEPLANGYTLRENQAWREHEDKQQAMKDDEGAIGFIAIGWYVCRIIQLYCIPVIRIKSVVEGKRRQYWVLAASEFLPDRGQPNGKHLLLLS
jgi:hypothetical protein